MCGRELYRCVWRRVNRSTTRDYRKILKYRYTRVNTNGSQLLSTDYADVYLCNLWMKKPHLRSASTRTRPVELLGAVILKSAESVGAMSAGVADSKYRPALTPAPMMIVGTCVSY